MTKMIRSKINKDNGPSAIAVAALSAASNHSGSSADQTRDHLPESLQLMADNSDQAAFAGLLQGIADGSAQTLARSNLPRVSPRRPTQRLVL